jgi:hypothetical protein
MATASGMPLPSVNMLRFVPDLPRSVGFLPVASLPKGAFVITPSTACHSHSMPFNSSYLFGKPRPPQPLEEPFPLPFLEAVMHGGTRPQLHR